MVVRHAAALSAMLALAACGTGEPELAPSCPRVDAVEGLDRLNLAFPGADQPVRTALDIIEVGCVLEDEAFLVAAAVAVRVGGNRPPGVLEVPLTYVIETPAGMTPNTGAVALIPPGATGTIEYYEHSFPPAVAGEDVLVRILYALVPDAAELERLSRERPRP